MFYVCLFCCLEQVFHGKISKYTRSTRTRNALVPVYIQLTLKSRVINTFGHNHLTRVFVLGVNKTTRSNRNDISIHINITFSMRRENETKTTSVVKHRELQ